MDRRGCNMQVETCQICGKLAPVTYTCRQCRRMVCEACFRHEVAVCSECYSYLKGSTPLLTLPLKLFLLGFTLIFLGTILLLLSSIFYGSVQPTTGAVIIVGPIPIVLGTGPYSIFAIILAIILTIVSIAFFVLLQKRR